MRASLCHRVACLIVAAAGLGAAGQVERPPAEASPEPERATAAPVPAGPADESQPTLAGAHDLFMSGAYDRAAEAYVALLEAPDKALQAGLGLARCRLQTGQYDAGLDGLQTLNAQDSADWHELVARFHLHRGGYDKVLEHTTAAVERDKNSAAARRLQAETLEYLGRRDEAIEAYRWFDRQIAGGRDLPREPAWMTDTAIGFVRYSVLTQTNVAQRTQHALQQMLQMAYERLDRSYWPARVAAADLLREKYNNGEEDGSVSDYNAALRTNPNLPQAHVGLGEVALEGWQFEEVEKNVAKALEVNPRFAPAFHLSAKKLLLERRYEQAKEACEQALAVNPHDIVAIALSAAASACRYDAKAVEELWGRARAINPKCAVFHRLLGDALGGIRQYAASEGEYKEAIELDPTDANARTELGMMYMQWGLEDRARDALDAAWALDKYNQRTKFTLDLLDQLQHFDRHETSHFTVRHDGKKDPGLGEYVADYLEPIHDAVTGDYDVALADKTIIEFFPTHRSFGVRITGKPWIHTVGACTGRVIALSTPRESVDLMGRYNLSRVLMHEFTHTVTLAATENRIPHWFTEGLAVYQENAPRGFDWMELLAEAIRNNRLFTLQSIDWGFIRPKRATDRQMAYAQSEWMCEYIIERFGYGSIRGMLEQFREGKTQEAVFREQLKLELADFDGDFATWAKQQAASWGFDLTPSEDLEDLRRLASSQSANAEVFGRLARAELDELDIERALAAARKAVEMDANERVGLSVLVKVLGIQAAESPEPLRPVVEEEAMPAIKRLLEVDPSGWVAPKTLAEILLRREDWDGAKEALLRLQRLCPHDPFSWSALAAIALQDDDESAALPLLVELARLEANDPDVPGKVADILRHQGNLSEARYWYRQALAIDPFNVSLHQQMGSLCLQSGDAKAALREFQMMTRIDPKNAGHFESAAIAADRSGDEKLASEFAARAVALNPQSGARRFLSPPDPK